MHTLFSDMRYALRQLGKTPGFSLAAVTVGVFIGAAGALALGRVLAKLVYGVSTTDFGTLLVVSLLLLVVALLATILPAYRATRVEPVQILREE